MLPGANQGQVSNRAVLINLEACRAQGADARPLLSVFGDEQHGVTNPSGRCSWDAYARFLDQIEALLGGPLAMEKMAFDFVRTNPSMAALASVLVDVEKTYFFAVERFARHMYRGIPINLTRVAPGRLRYEYRFPPPLRPSKAFFAATIGALRAHPKNLGLPEAVVDGLGSARGGLLLVDLPKSRDVVTRLRSSLATAVRSIRTPLDGDLDYLQAALDDGPLFERGRALGEALFNAGNAERVADELFGWLQSEYGTHILRLMFQGRSMVRGNPAQEASCSRALTVGDSQVGRMDVDVPCRLEEDPPLLRGALPWIATALASTQDATPGEAWLVRLRRHSQKWQLPPRQQQALVLLAKGCSNKEMAAALGCSLKGAEAHVSRLLRKAKLSSRSELLSLLARDP